MSDVDSDIKYEHCNNSGGEEGGHIVKQNYEFILKTNVKMWKYSVERRSSIESNNSNSD